MPIATAPLLIDAPSIPAAPRFGLLSAAQIVDGPDPHWVDGIEYPTTPRPHAVTDDVECDQPDLTDLISGVDWVTDAPLRVWSGLTSKIAAWTEDEIISRARDMLTAGEGTALERSLWPLIADPATLPAGDDPVSLLAGIGAVEAWLWESYGGVGVVHVPRTAVPYLARAHQVREVNGQLRTPLGTVVSAGAYPGRGPDDEAPAAGATLSLIHI